VIGPVLANVFAGLGWVVFGATQRDPWIAALSLLHAGMAAFMVWAWRTPS
jgi:hypothetical protein